MVITDSADDQDLLDAVRQGVLIEPQHSPMPQHYVPLYYLARFKRTPRFVTNQTLLEELPIALLITVLFLPFAWSTWISAGLLFGSFLLADVQAQATSTLTLEEGEDDCAGDGWQQFSGQGFADEQGCRDYFQSVYDERITGFVD